MFITATGFVLGGLLGMRHALEPDHLAAVSTLVIEQRSSRSGALLGAFWGIGHTLALLGVGLVLACLKAQMPARLADVFELGVAVMLLGLGVRAIRRAASPERTGEPTEHRHRDGTHQHAGPPHIHVGQWTLAQRPLLIGLVHGLAGSGALTVLVLASLPSMASRLVYMALFGLGSATGMALLSGLAGWPLARFGRGPRTARLMVLATGTFSSILGVIWGWPLCWRLLLRAT